jgi:hypothetical protein
MTIEQIKVLEEYEDLFYTATERNYVMFGSIQKKKRLSELYTDIIGKKSNMMTGCGRCALREMKELGTIYFQNNKVLKGFEQTIDNSTDTEVVKKNKTTNRSQKRNTK